jgi:S-formylglutathione hydrolase FrmB
MKHGLKYWQFISEELPLLIQQLFPVSTRREDTFVAGFSMGGYGALKLALNHPEGFAAAGAMSSVTDIAAKFDDPRYAGWQFEDIFGSPELLAADGNDLFASLDKTAKAPQKPRIIQICGTEDYLWQDNLKLKDAFKKNNYPDYVFESHPGVHSWDFWDVYIQDILKFFFQ